MAEVTELAGMLKTLLEDRKQRVAEVEDERRRRDEELREERRRRDEEAARCDEAIQQQMDVLRELVEGVRQQGDTAARKAEHDKDVKVSKLTQDDDIEAYLLTFERLMQAYEIKPERWAFKLAPQLVGKAQQAYAALTPEAAADYEQLKKAILRRYDVNEETYRQCFRVATWKSSETARELVVRLEDLATKWTKDCKIVEELRDAVVMEQLLNMLPKEIRVWVKERRPTSDNLSMIMLKLGSRMWGWRTKAENGTVCNQ